MCKPLFFCPLPLSCVTAAVNAGLLIGRLCSELLRALHAFPPTLTVRRRAPPVQACACTTMPTRRPFVTVKDDVKW